MQNQTFRETIPIKILDELLKEYCQHQESYYIFNNNSYKILSLKKQLPDFIEKITPYYHTSKKHYVTRPLNTKRLLTIIRQICRLHNIPYVSNLTYNHSTYDISYKIYMPYIGLTSD